MEKDVALLEKQARDKSTKHSQVEFILKADDATGELEAVFSTFGVVDSDGDIVLASAFLNGQAVPVVWHHDWTRPVGRGVVIVESDRAILRGRFFIETVDGQQAYLTVKAMAELQEWSWGFRIEEAAYEQRGDQWIRIIKRAEIFEVSPVLKGAGMGTYTMAIKSSTLNDQYGATLAGLQDMIERFKSLADLRSKSGRVLSEANRQRLSTLRNAMSDLIAEVDDLLVSTEPEKAHSGAELFAEFQLTMARLNGVTV